MTPIGFVTVSEASKKLELSERHVRRLAGHLPDTCRTFAGHVPLRVSLVELAKLAGKSIEAGHDAGHLPDTKESDAGHVPDMGGHGGDALIEQLRTENARLWDALQREQSISMAAVADAGELRRKLLALGPLEKPTEADSTKPEGSTVAPGGQGAQNRSVEAGMGFLARVRGWLGGGSR